MKMVTSTIMASQGIKLSYPFIHGNGSSGRDLLNKLKAANSSVKKTIEALRETAPNGRDYGQRDKNNDFRVARQEFEDRLQALHKIEQELMDLAVAVYNQIN